MVGDNPGAAFGAVLTVGVAVAFWAYCLRDFARTDEREMQVFSRPVWLAILVVGNVFGAVMWFVAGRRR